MLFLDKSLRSGRVLHVSDLCILVTLIVFCMLSGCGSKEDISPEAKATPNASQVSAKKSSTMAPEKSNGPDSTAKAPTPAPHLSLPEDNGGWRTKPKETNLDSIEVIPPNELGERGITQQMLNASIAAQKNADLDLIEVIPPDDPGGRGVTLGEVKSLRGVPFEKGTGAERIDPDLEVIPPVDLMQTENTGR
jgi:hypothetical protein